MVYNFTLSAPTNSKYQFYLIIVNSLLKSRFGITGGNVYQRMLVAAFAGWFLAELKNDYWPLIEYLYGTCTNCLLDLLETEFGITQNDIRNLLRNITQMFLVIILSISLVALIYATMIAICNVRIHTYFILYVAMLIYIDVEIFSILYNALNTICILNSDNTNTPEYGHIYNDHFNDYWRTYTSRYGDNTI